MTTKPPMLHLHLGAHKTATTFIQACLKANTDALREQGVAYLPHGGVRRNISRQLMLRKDLTEVTPELVQSRQAARNWFVQAATRACDAGAGTIVVSDENLMVVTLKKLITARLDYDAEAKLGLLKQTFFGYPIRIFYAIRDQGPTASSMFAENIRAGRNETISLEGTRKTWLKARPSWVPVIKRMIDAFPDAQVVVWQYEHFDELRDIILEFMCNGATLPEAAPSAIVRPSLSDAAVLRLLSIQNEEGSLARMAAVAEVAKQFPAGANGPPFSLWSRREARLFSRDYARDVRAVGKLSPNVTMLRPTRRWKFLPWRG